MPPQYRVIAFQNTNSYPVSVFIRGIRGKVCLWQGQQIKSREGNPIVPHEAEWPWLIRLGVKPVYLAIPDQQPYQPKDDDSVQTVLDDTKLMEAKAAAQAANQATEIYRPPSPEQAEALGSPAQEEPASPSPAPVSYLDRPDNPDPTKGNLVWQDRDGVWILNKDGFNSINPAVIKKHVRRVKSLGKDFLEALEWRGFGAKPEPAKPPVPTS